MRTSARFRRPDERQVALEEARRAATQARAEAVRLRCALDVLDPAVVVYDESHRVVFRNRGSLELAASGHTGALVDAAVEEVLTKAGGSDKAVRHLEVHGPPSRFLEITAVSLGDQSAAMGTIVVIDDVSERRRLDAVRRDFVANVSHELRTPIGALGVLAETLNGEDHPATVQRLSARIAAEVDRARRLIEDLLDLSIIEGGGVQPPNEADMAKVVTVAVDQVLPLAGQRQVEVRSQRTPALVVLGDERQLVSAVSNLLENAIKYSDPGSNVEVGWAVTGAWLELTVRDHGIGIPAKDIVRIFERFYRVDRARSRETGGTGLGLAIVNHVANNHGGHVHVDSREGEGSTFTLRLPVSRQ